MDRKKILVVMLLSLAAVGASFAWANVDADGNAPPEKRGCSAADARCCG